MIINSTIITICAILLLLAVVAPLANPFFRNVKIADKDDEIETEDGGKGNYCKQQQLPHVSIVITAHDNAAELRRNLPLVLNQVYPAEFQVIVVAEKGDNATEDILKQLSVNNNHLYYTLLPESSRYMSRKKLAITLGVKAAAHEWVLLTEPSCKPMSNLWLSTMARNCHNDIDLVIGFTNYEKDTKLYPRFEHFQTECYSIREAQANVAYRHNGANLMFRKSLFMKQEGFRGNLNLVRGEYDFLVNDFAASGNTSVETSPLAHLHDDAPTHKAWVYHHMYYLETRKLLRRSFKHRLVFNVDQILLHASAISIATALVVSSLMSQWIVTIAAIVALILTSALRSLFMSKRAKGLGESFPAILALPLQLSVVWHHAKYYINHKFADKLDFTTHKL